MALSVICYGHLPNAQSRAEYKRYGEGSSNHGQEVLEAKEETHIPGWNIVYLVSDPEISLLLSHRVIFHISRRLGGHTDT